MVQGKSEKTSNGKYSSLLGNLRKAEVTNLGRKLKKKWFPNTLDFHFSVLLEYIEISFLEKALHNGNDEDNIVHFDLIIVRMKQHHLNYLLI